MDIAQKLTGLHTKINQIFYYYREKIIYIWDHIMFEICKV